MKELFIEIMKNIKNISITFIKVIKSWQKAKGIKVLDNSEK